MDNVKSSFIDFNIIDISSDDFQTGPEYHEREFMLTFYGKTKDHKNVVCNIIGYKPYFYLRIPNNCGRRFTKRLLETIKQFIQSKPKVRAKLE